MLESGENTVVFHDGASGGWYTQRGRMSEFQEIEREEIAVQFVRVPDGLEHIRRAWDELEAVVPLRGRHFYGAFDPVANDYRACVELRRVTSSSPGLESGTLPGGRYLRARLRGDPPAVYEQIEAVVALRVRHFYGAFDPIADDYRACVEVREGDEPSPRAEPARCPAAVLPPRARCAATAGSTSGSGRPSTS